LQPVKLGVTFAQIGIANLAHDKLVNEQEWNVHFSIGLF
jgi:hypothetical protein